MDMTNGCEVVSHCRKICTSLMIINVQYHFIGLLAICISSVEMSCNVYSSFLPIFFNPHLRKCLLMRERERERERREREREREREKERH